MDSWKYTIVGRTRRMDTKDFTITVDLQSNKIQDGIVRFFLGPRINNKQQLNENRKNFVELDQFIVKLNQGQNIIKRNSRDFKNIVGEPETMNTLYFRALNLMNKKNNGKDMNTLNFDTNNNNHGFPHRLVLPKGTVGGEDYTLYVICSDLKHDNYERIQYRDNLNTFNVNGLNAGDHGSNESGNESNESGSFEMNGRDGKNRNFEDMRRMNDKNNMDRQGRNDDNMDRQGRNDDNMDRQVFNGNDRTVNNLDRNIGRGNWEKNNGVMIHNFNNGNKNCGNGNGVLDNRAMGFPLDRQINDVTGFITNNMYFKDVTIYHVDNLNYRNNRDYWTEGIFLAVKMHS